LSYTPWPGIDVWSEQGIFRGQVWGRADIIEVLPYGVVYGTPGMLYPDEGLALDTVRKQIGLKSVQVWRAYNAVTYPKWLILQYLFMERKNMNDFLGMHFWHSIGNWTQGKGGDQPTGNCKLRLYSDNAPREQFPSLDFGTNPAGAWEEKLWNVDMLDFHGLDKATVLNSIYGAEFQAELTGQARGVAQWIDNFFIWRPFQFNPIFSVRAIDVDDGKAVVSKATIVSPLGAEETWDVPFSKRVSPGIWTITMQDVGGQFLKWSDGDVQRTKILDIQQDVLLTAVYKRAANGGQATNLALIAGLGLVTVVGAGIVYYATKRNKRIGR